MIKIKNCFVTVALLFMAGLASADGISNPPAPLWARLITCGDTVAIDVSGYTYQIVLKTEIADKFASAGFSRNPSNQNEVIFGNSTWYGPAGCSFSDNLQRTIVHWSGDGNSKVVAQITGSNSITIRSDVPSATVPDQSVSGCTIPQWMSQ